LPSDFSSATTFTNLVTLVLNIRRHVGGVFLVLINEILKMM
jgi:hypothetical protein